MRVKSQAASEQKSVMNETSMDQKYFKPTEMTINSVNQKPPTREGSQGDMLNRLLDRNEDLAKQRNQTTKDHKSRRLPTILAEETVMEDTAQEFCRGD